MDLEWVYDTIQSQLIVRVDIARTGSGGYYQQLSVVVLAGFWDEDGFDPACAKYSVNESYKASPLEFSSLLLRPKEEILAFLADEVDTWQEAWRVEKNNLFRLRERGGHGQKDRWHTLSFNDYRALQMLARVEGALGEFANINGESVKSREALRSLRFRLNGLLATANRSLEAPARRTQD